MRVQLTTNKNESDFKHQEAFDFSFFLKKDPKVIEKKCCLLFKNVSLKSTQFNRFSPRKPVFL